MKRFASLATTAALAGALVGIGTASQAAQVLNLYLVPISPTNATYNPGDKIKFNALVDIPVGGSGPITLTLGVAVAYDISVFDVNGLRFDPDTSAYPPKPAINLWDLSPPAAYNNLNNGEDTFQGGVGHTKQTTQPGNKTTTIPGGTYTVGTFSFPVIKAIDAAHPSTIILPSAFGLPGVNATQDFINNTDATGTNDDTLAFPNSGGKFSSLTYGASGGGQTPAPSSLLVVAMGAAPVVGLLRRRRK